jgi:hypothetical protein
MTMDIINNGNNNDGQAREDPLSSTAQSTLVVVLRVSITRCTCSTTYRKEAQIQNIAPLILLSQLILGGVVTGE